ncbi:MAG: Holliday junction ATP-dependent DNA helicase RuvA [Verrucomicrobia subdivision 3 bacterium]|nr:Holliday junction ATP-dependent DNA helicase RuvA [Limisphaerales bacterium]MCS1413849.1 Holliday junction ATP-dependent DNA helicase RuvA [Limisphaerales bacterium]
MITHLSGTIVESNPAQVIIDVQGVGYEVLIPSSSFSNLPPPGQSARIFTHLAIRDDAHILFGFATTEERKLFRLVNTVTGIGPKIALNVLSGMNPPEFKTAVAEGNTKRLSQISGLGKKTAERIVVELKDKLGAPAEWQTTAGRQTANAAEQTMRDAIAALVSLGYKQPDATHRVKVAQTMLGKDVDLDKLVKASLTS